MNDSVIHLNDKNGDVNLENLYPALVECFTIILCGYAAGRLNLISQQECKGLNVFVSSFSLPSLIFLSLAQLDLSSVNWMFLGSILLAKSIVFFGVLIITFCISRPVHYGKPGIYAVFCTQSNDFAIGYPILTALYSRSHPDYPAYLYLMAPISLAILNPIAFVLMELGKRQEATEAKNKNIENLNKEEIAESTLQTSDFTERTIQRETVDSDVDMLTENHAETNDDRKIERDFNLDKRKAQIKFCGAIFKSIFSNPIVFMTALGLIGNFFFKYIKFVGGILEVFGSAFSATALFVLGLRMVGTVQKLKGNALLVPGVLIIIKLLVLPLVTREVVSLLQPGSNASETLDLSTFGFLYGTFPTAPAVFVFSTQYNLETELISSSMVACTFISAPLMFISARMTSLDNTAPENHFRELQSYGCDLGIIGIILGLWLIFLFIMNKSYTKLPHKITGFLIISQMIICVGVLLEPITENSKSWTLYIQFAVFAFGVYSSRIWSCFLAITLVLLQSRSLCFVIKLLPIFIIVGWGLPVILVAVVCIAASPDYTMGSLVNPNFQYGSLQAAVTLFVLLVTFVVTSGCLILQQRYRRRYARYLLLVQEVNSKDLQEIPGVENGDVNSQPTPSSSSSRVRLQQVVDIEEIVSENGSKEYRGCENRGDLCSSKFHCTEAQREACELNVKEYNEHITSEEIDPDAGHDLQIMGHVVLLLLIVTSLFVGIMLSIWTLVVNDIFSGIYVELAFLDVTLNVGQICVTFAVFGLEVRTILNPLINTWRRCIYGEDTIILTPVEELSFETTHVCHQFIAHQLKKCEKDIAKDIRVRLTLYKDCFKGKSLVIWLQEKRLAKDTAEAVQYASHLLEGRVIRHVENRHHFVNSNLLYTFKSK